MSIHKISTVGRSKVTNSKTEKQEEVLVHNRLLGGSKSLAKAIKFANNQRCDTIIS